MLISDYLRAKDGRLSKNGTTCRQLAKKLGVTSYYLYMVALGHKRLNPEKAPTIEIETNFQVTRRDVWPSFPWDMPKAA